MIPYVKKYISIYIAIYMAIYMTICAAKNRCERQAFLRFVDCYFSCNTHQQLTAKCGNRVFTAAELYTGLSKVSIVLIRTERCIVQQGIYRC